MAKKKKYHNQPREHLPEVKNPYSISAQDYDVEKVRISADISDITNDRIRTAIQRLEGLSVFMKDTAKEEDSQTLIEGVRDEVKGLFDLNIQNTYNKLVENVGRREQLYQEMIKKGVIVPEDIAVFSSKNYLRYIADLNNRRPAADKLDISELDNLQNANGDNLDKILGDLETTGRITRTESAKLKTLGPVPDAQLQAAREAFYQKLQNYDAGHSTAYNSKYRQVQRVEEGLENQIEAFTEKYNQVMQKVVEEMNKLHESHENNESFKRELKALKAETGLPLSKGQELWGEDINATPGPDGRRPRTNNIVIDDITPTGILEPDPILGELAERGVVSTEPVIHLTMDAHDGSGQRVKLALRASTFARWVIALNVVEKIADLPKLEETLDLPAGLIKPGLKLEYLTRKGKIKDEDEPDFDQHQVEILKIENDQIHLSKEVLIDEAHPDTGLSGPRQSKVLDFGEFAKWYRKYQTCPEITDLKMLDQMLAKHHQTLITEMGWPEKHGQPINLSKGPFPQALLSAYGDHKNIHYLNSAKPGKIIFDEAELTPAQFYRLVKSEGFTRPTAEQIQELQAAAAKEEDKQAQNALNAAADKGNIPKTVAGPDSGPSPKKSGKGYFATLWENTSFINLIELYELLWKIPIDRAKEYMKDQSERRVYKTAKDLYKGIPYLGIGDLAGRYEDKHNGKIAEDVKKKFEWFEANAEPKDVFEALYGAKKIVVYKAALQFLTKKGLIRWEDDEKLMEVTNKFFPYTKYPSKFHEDLGKDAIVEVGDKNALRKSKALSVFDQYRACFDGKWGDGTFDRMYQENDRAYNDRKKYVREHMHDYEYLHGRIGRSLQKMLFDFQNGAEVDAAEFEGLLIQAAQKNEIPFEQAVFLYVAAFGQKRQDGKTLLTYSRAQNFVPEMRDHIMWIYFALNYEKVDENGNPLIDPTTGKPVKDKLRTEDYGRLFKQVMQKDVDAMKADNKKGLDTLVAGRHTINWIQSTILTDPKYISTAANKAGNMDTPPDVYDYIGPTITDKDALDRIIRKGGYGPERMSNVKNMYAGYNNQLIIRANKLNTGKNKEENIRFAKQFAEMYYGYLYFNNAVRGRIGGRNQFLHVTDKVLSDRPDRDGDRTVGEFHDELVKFSNNFGADIARLSGNTNLLALHREIVTSQADRLNEQNEQIYREEIMKEISRLAVEKPRELAAAARHAAIELKGMSGKSLSKQEREERDAMAA
ncbi:hypothetical protein IT411_02265 [Candidatus Peregrinibacteria bacterium]|nr:hypothetical protein [Candidatus Peregrinibacteria bacterium]